MALLTVNNYILLEEAAEPSSQFGSKGENDNKYKVAVCGDMECKPGDTIYVLNTLGKVNVDGKEYTVAQKDEVVAYVA